jgi:glucokinase
MNCSKRRNAMPEGRSAVLCADIGGSNTRLALAERTPAGLDLIARESYVNAEANGLAELMRRFLSRSEAPAAACLAVAGPTDGTLVTLTNLDWTIDARQLSLEFGFPVRLVNDFEAVVWGLEAVPSARLVVLQAGQSVPQAPRLALGPGTGLGVAHSVWLDDRYGPLPGEGGHVAFAPADVEQIALLNFLQAKFGRVSAERILSGPGIADLYAFCRTASGRPVKRQRTAAEVSAAALDGSDPIAVWAMRLFVRILGQTTGDLALITGARGGVYLAGGIPPRILSLLEGDEFLNGFRGKGRFSAAMRNVPVHVVTDPDIGLKGAALAAYSMPSRSTR